MRLFFAVNLSAAFKEKMAELIEELRQYQVKVKWVKPENIHLTLHFLGEVEKDKSRLLGIALKKAVSGMKPWNIEIKGTGAFPNWKEPRVIWLGVHSEAPLYELQKKLVSQCTPLGFPPDKTGYKPHITLGRPRQWELSGPLQDRLQKMAAMSWGFERVEEVSLMSSSLNSRGAVYSPILTVNLTNRD